MRLLRQWGGRAAPALPVPYELLTCFPLPAAPAIAAECPPGERRRGGTLTSTAGHKFYVVGRGSWLDAGLRPERR